MTILGIFTLVLELIIAAVGVQIATRKKKPHSYGWLLAAAFIAYVMYDLSRLTGLAIEPTILELLISMATISAFFAIWQIKEQK